MNMQGAIVGMIFGILLMLFYMLKYKLGYFGGGGETDWWWKISPEGFGSVAMCANFVTTMIVSRLTSPPPEAVQALVEEIGGP